MFGYYRESLEELYMLLPLRMLSLVQISPLLFAAHLTELRFSITYFLCCVAGLMVLEAVKVLTGRSKDWFSFLPPEQYIRRMHQV